MSFYISLSGLKAAQADLSTISNNVANVNATAFKKSRSNFGDIFAAAPMQTTTQVAGQGTRINGIQQQFTQGTIETTDKTLDLAITGESFFTVRTPPPTAQISYTRNGAFELDENRYVVDTVGGRLQVLPVDANGVPTSTAAGSLSDLQIPVSKPGAPTVQLSSVGVSVAGLVTATFADGTTQMLGTVAMAAFPSQEGLRQQGDAHWQATLQSGDAVYGQGNAGLYGAVRSGALERSNVDITEELVALISAQRNFQANAKAIESASNMTQAIVNLRS
ncbi:flagellar hook-basal body complex protein [Sphingobium subterraneum]|uniref:Flagellar hook protein FlgE n=1 Tax=Sphingobium subterraneum TaxID=627688 RepID=A0A841J6H9_9SPHN|nr:flagellar hook-basal body complex protein [Sphingobium subterraneum]MBB6123811.1 flagellar hook protein FlgE [Sphingobium subterraneum]